MEGGGKCTRTTLEAEGLGRIGRLFAGLSGDLLAATLLLGSTTDLGLLGTTHLCEQESESTIQMRKLARIPYQER